MQPAVVPPEMAPLLDALIEVIGNAEWIILHHTWLREAFAGRGCGDIPSSVPEGFVYTDLPPREGTPGDRSRLLVERTGAARAFPGGPTLAMWVQHRDQLFWSIVDFYEAVHAAREALPAAAIVVDSPSHPPLERWSVRLRRMLGEIGGVLSTNWHSLPPINDEDLGKGLRVHFQHINDAIQDLKALGPAQLPAMPVPTGRPSDVERLEAVRTKVRALVSTNPALKEEMAGAFVRYAELVKRRGQLRRDRSDLEWSRAREILLSGHLLEPAARKAGPTFRVNFEGLCPDKLARQLEKAGPAHSYPAELEAVAASAALVAMDRSTEYLAARSTPRAEEMATEWRAAVRSGEYVGYTWRVEGLMPAEWQNLEDPADVSPHSLGQMEEADRQYTVMYLLGGLSDTGSAFPIVRRPGPSGDIEMDASINVAWRYRRPVSREHHDLEVPPLDPTVFPPDLAEEMLVQLSGWITAGLVGSVRQSSPLPPAPGISVEVEVRPEGSTERPANTDDEGWFPAAYYDAHFGIGSDRLRKAAERGRISKRRMAGRTASLYSIDEVRQEWPQDVDILPKPKEV